ncbi:hypothetical protein EMIHUDRAFT_238876 [Emiliania huxleyi CCMP1516]|uniref:Uncharacterized protein n=2 Tax=Emiliania huxleyi TaxID=2903 RepID=A0A0D3JKW9_EMIH1|nr:hypothetical protein EMIHUDRAFT_238876 [Emiliania huxleyi CCMP1516]EOD24154.1 hypothetical protein EMIHUDRAFT_238876 [Emiliania huxleyi CCMP1516]|eukprot:XP_005776583.1 hypothetical protein EMIHUDRAFT_238876 [Emiliania huxleyi CCMP1516]
MKLCMECGALKALTEGIPFYVSFLVGDGEGDLCPPPGTPHPALDALRASLGDATVWCVDWRDHAAAWGPKFFGGISALADGHRGTQRPRHPPQLAARR